MATDSLTITDNRTGKTYEIPILYGTFPTYGAAIRSADLRQIKVSDDDFGLMGYDPAFMNTASCKSAITHIDGERGILRYRGYPIEQLAEQSNYLEVAYLLIHGELPTKAQYDEWVHNIIHHTMVHENLKKFTDGFHYDAHPMGMLVSTLAALSTFYPASKKVTEAETRKLEIYRLIGKAITLGAMAYRHIKGLPYVTPDNDLSYTGNFMNMLWKMAEPKYRPNPILEKALDVLFILHADHEQNCSTNAMRSVGSSQSDPYCAAAGGTAALYGPLHGGANEQVLRMLRQIGSKDKIPQFIQDVKDRKALLMGFGHRVYKNYDPRARILKEYARRMSEKTKFSRFFKINDKLEKTMVERKGKQGIFPNVDLYSGIVYHQMGIATDIFTPIFAMARVSGWTAHVLEYWQDNKLFRPNSIYEGPGPRKFVPISQR